MCQILGISLNEFFAGEDIVQENLVQKSEENIIGIAADGKRRQNLLKMIICLLLAISVLATSIIGLSVYRASRPQNFITPLDKDSIEMETAKMLSGPDGAYIYKFTTTDSSKLSTEIPILEGVADRAYYGRSATEISEKTDIRYNEEQALMALLYGRNELRVMDINDFLSGQTDSLRENDFTYFFSLEFCKE